MSPDLSAAARAAADAVDAAAIRDELQALVRIRSVTGHEEAMAEVLANRLGDAGMAADWLLPDPAAIRADPAWPGEETERTTLPVVIARLGRPGGRRIVLSGHMDVVPPGDPDTWSVDPWAGEIREGRLYGRGACDMKGGVAAILGAVRALVASGASLNFDGELIVAFVPGEEDGGQGTLAAIRAGATGDLAIITEPSNLDIVVAHAGAITFRLTVPGRAAHASQRREGVSALDNLFAVLRGLEIDETARNEAETDPLMTALGLPYPTIVGIVQGGEWASTVMDRVVVDGRYGVRLGQSPADAATDLRRAIAGINASDAFLCEHPASVEIVGGQFGSGHVPSDHPLPVGLAAVAEAVTGRQPALLGEPYGADMRLFINEGGTPCVMYGPGDVKVAHSADEHVPLAQVEECARVLAAWVVRELGPR
ncbi:MAG TPA: ArgE/DapE family deacylase [Candidatus Acidoferrum sp.]|nr:ArgE/DapE family deacylase [Candidatus Acidoferrum sp.]